MHRALSSGSFPVSFIISHLMSALDNFLLRLYLHYSSFLVLLSIQGATELYYCHYF